MREIVTTTTAGGRGRDVRRKETFEAGNIAAPGSGDEKVDKMSLCGRVRRPPSAIGDMLASAGRHLPRVGLFKSKDVRDVMVRIVERLSQDVCSSFRGRQLLQQ
jgi:hypothetical protein